MRPTLKRKPRHQIKWQPETLERIVEMWNAKVRSVNEIAKAFGTTRGSIVGLIFRMRRNGRQDIADRIVGSRPENRPPRVMRGSHIQSSSPRRRIVVAPTPPPPPPVIVQPQAAHYVDIHALEQHHCREVMVQWPKALYCGTDKKKGSSFCHFHHEKNWITPTARVR